MIVARQVSGAIFFHSDHTLLRLDSINHGNFPAVLEAVTRSGRPMYAVLYPHEVDEAFSERLQGRWRQFDAVRQVGIWKFEPGEVQVAP